MMLKLKSSLLFLLLCLGIQAYSADKDKSQSKKGEMYMYWGWNRGWYTNSDIHFNGPDFDFTLQDVVAKDRQTPFSVNDYLNPTYMSIPQYNFRIGYFFSDKYNISIGADHMKYVMAQDQTVKINGEIRNPGTVYDGVYNDDDIILYEEFLSFEHTDGLNYANIEIRRFDVLYAWKMFDFSVTEGLGVGLLIPKTNAKLMDIPRHDEFHVAGWGLDAVLGANVTFYKHFFVQSEFKVGYMNMPDIEVSHVEADRADQDFFFSQLNIVFGLSINLSKKENSN